MFWQFCRATLTERPDLSRFGNVSFWFLRPQPRLFQLFAWGPNSREWLKMVSRVDLVDLLMDPKSSQTVENLLRLKSDATHSIQVKTKASNKDYYLACLTGSVSPGQYVQVQPDALYELEFGHCGHQHLAGDWQASGRWMFPCVLAFFGMGQDMTRPS